MNEDDPTVIIVGDMRAGGVRASHPSFSGYWGIGSDEPAARHSLAIAIRLAREGGTIASAADPITLRYDRQGRLDEIVADRSVHLERIDERLFYVTLGTLVVGLAIAPDGSLGATLIAGGDDEVVVQPAYVLGPGGPACHPAFLDPGGIESGG